jgi:hypothetical protein
MRKLVSNFFKLNSDESDTSPSNPNNNSNNSTAATRKFSITNRNNRTLSKVDHNNSQLILSAAQSLTESIQNILSNTPNLSVDNLTGYQQLLEVLDDQEHYIQYLNEHSSQEKRPNHEGKKVAGLSPPLSPYQPAAATSLSPVAPASVSAASSDVTVLLKFLDFPNFIELCYQVNIATSLYQALRLLRMLEIIQAKAESSSAADDSHAVSIAPTNITEHRSDSRRTSLTIKGITFVASLNICRILEKLCSSPVIIEQLRQCLVKLLVFPLNCLPLQGKHIQLHSSWIISAICKTGFTSQQIWFLHDAHYINYALRAMTELLDMHSTSSNSSSTATRASSSSVTSLSPPLSEETEKTPISVSASAGKAQPAPTEVLLKGVLAESFGMWLDSLKCLLEVLNCSLSVSTALLSDFESLEGPRLLIYVLSNASTDRFLRCLNVISPLIFSSFTSRRGGEGNDNSGMNSGMGDPHSNFASSASSLTVSTAAASHTFSKTTSIFHEFFLSSFLQLSSHSSSQQKGRGNTFVLGIRKNDTIDSMIDLAHFILENSLLTSSKEYVLQGLSYAILTMYSMDPTTCIAIEERYNVLPMLVLCLPSVSLPETISATLTTFNYICQCIESTSSSLFLAINASIFLMIELAIPPFPFLSSSASASASFHPVSAGPSSPFMTSPPSLSPLKHAHPQSAEDKEKEEERRQLSLQFIELIFSSIEAISRTNNRYTLLFMKNGLIKNVICETFERLAIDLKEFSGSVNTSAVSGSLIGLPVVVEELTQLDSSFLLVYDRILSFIIDLINKSTIASGGYLYSASQQLAQQSPFLSNLASSPAAVAVALAESIPEEIRKSGLNSILRNIINLSLIPATFVRMILLLFEELSKIDETYMEESIVNILRLTSSCSHSLMMASSEGGERSHTQQEKKEKDKEARKDEIRKNRFLSFLYHEKMTALFDSLWRILLYSKGKAIKYLKEIGPEATFQAFGSLQGVFLPFLPTFTSSSASKALSDPSAASLTLTDIPRSRYNSYEDEDGDWKSLSSSSPAAKAVLDCIESILRFFSLIIFYGKSDDLTSVSGNSFNMNNPSNKGNASGLPSLMDPSNNNGSNGSLMINNLRDPLLIDKIAYALVETKIFASSRHSVDPSSGTSIPALVSAAAIPPFASYAVTMIFEFVTLFTKEKDQLHEAAGELLIVILTYLDVKGIKAYLNCLRGYFQLDHSKCLLLCEQNHNILGRFFHMAYRYSIRNPELEELLIAFISEILVVHRSVELTSIIFQYCLRNKFYPSSSSLEDGEEGQQLVRPSFCVDNIDWVQLIAPFAFSSLTSASYQSSSLRFPLSSLSRSNSGIHEREKAATVFSTMELMEELMKHFPECQPSRSFSSGKKVASTTAYYLLNDDEEADPALQPISSSHSSGNEDVFGNHPSFSIPIARHAESGSLISMGSLALFFNENTAPLPATSLSISCWFKFDLPREGEKGGERGNLIGFPLFSLASVTDHAIITLEVSYMIPNAAHSSANHTVDGIESGQDEGNSNRRESERRHSAAASQQAKERSTINDEERGGVLDFIIHFVNLDNLEREELVRFRSTTAFASPSPVSPSPSTSSSASFPSYSPSHWTNVVLTLKRVKRFTHANQLITSLYLNSLPLTASSITSSASSGSSGNTATVQKGTANIIDFDALTVLQNGELRLGSSNLHPLSTSLPASSFSSLSSASSSRRKSPGFLHIGTVSCFAELLNPIQISFLFYYGPSYVGHYQHHDDTSGSSSSSSSASAASASSASIQTTTAASSDHFVTFSSYALRLAHSITSTNGSSASSSNSGNLSPLPNLNSHSLSKGFHAISYIERGGIKGIEYIVEPKHEQHTQYITEYEIPALPIPIVSISPLMTREDNHLLSFQDPAIPSSASTNDNLGSITTKMMLAMKNNKLQAISQPRRFSLLNIIDLDYENQIGVLTSPGFLSSNLSLGKTVSSFGGLDIFLPLFFLLFLPSDEEEKLEQQLGGSATDEGGKKKGKKDLLLSYIFQLIQLAIKQDLQNLKKGQLYSYRMIGFLFHLLSSFPPLSSRASASAASSSLAEDLFSEKTLQSLLSFAIGYGKEYYSSQQQQLKKPSLSSPSSDLAIATASSAITATSSSCLLVDTVAFAYLIYNHNVWNSSSKFSLFSSLLSHLKLLVCDEKYKIVNCMRLSSLGFIRWILFSSLNIVIEAYRQENAYLIPFLTRSTPKAVSSTAAARSRKDSTQWTGDQDGDNMGSTRESSRDLFGNPMEESQRRMNASSKGNSTSNSSNNDDYWKYKRRTAYEMSDYRDEPEEWLVNANLIIRGIVGSELRGKDLDLITNIIQFTFNVAGEGTHSSGHPHHRSFSRSEREKAERESERKSRSGTPAEKQEEDIEGADQEEMTEAKKIEKIESYLESHPFCTFSFPSATSCIPSDQANDSSSSPEDCSADRSPHLSSFEFYRIYLLRLLHSLYDDNIEEIRKRRTPATRHSQTSSSGILGSVTSNPPNISSSSASTINASHAQSESSLVDNFEIYRERCSPEWFLSILERCDGEIATKSSCLRLLAFFLEKDMLFAKDFIEKRKGFQILHSLLLAPSSSSSSAHLSFIQPIPILLPLCAMLFHIPSQLLLHPMQLKTVSKFSQLLELEEECSTNLTYVTESWLLTYSLPLLNIFYECLVKILRREEALEAGERETKTSAIVVTSAVGEEARKGNEGKMDVKTSSQKEVISEEEKKERRRKDLFDWGKRAEELLLSILETAMQYSLSFRRLMQNKIAIELHINAFLSCTNAFSDYGAVIYPSPPKRETSSSSSSSSSASSSATAAPLWLANAEEVDLTKSIVDENYIPSPPAPSSSSGSSRSFSAPPSILDPFSSSSSSKRSFSSAQGKPDVRFVENERRRSGTTATDRASSSSSISNRRSPLEKSHSSYYEDEEAYLSLPLSILNKSGYCLQRMINYLIRSAIREEDNSRILYHLFLSSSSSLSSPSYERSYQAMIVTIFSEVAKESQGLENHIIASIVRNITCIIPLAKAFFLYDITLFEILKISISLLETITSMYELHEITEQLTQIIRDLVNNSRFLIYILFSLIGTGSSSSSSMSGGGSFSGSFSGASGLPVNSGGNKGGSVDRLSLLTYMRHKLDFLFYLPSDDSLELLFAVAGFSSRFTASSMMMSSSSVTSSSNHRPMNPSVGGRNSVEEGLSLTSGPMLEALQGLAGGSTSSLSNQRKVSTASTYSSSSASSSSSSSSFLPAAPTQHLSQIKTERNRLCSVFLPFLTCVAYSLVLDEESFIRAEATRILAFLSQRRGVLLEQMISNSSPFVQRVYKTSLPSTPGSGRDGKGEEEVDIGVDIFHEGLMKLVPNSEGKYRLYLSGGTDSNENEENRFADFSYWISDNNMKCDFMFHFIDSLLHSPSLLGNLFLSNHETDELSKSLKQKSKIKDYFNTIETAENVKSSLKRQQLGQNNGQKMGKQYLLWKNEGIKELTTGALFFKKTWNTLRASPLWGYGRKIELTTENNGESEHAVTPHIAQEGIEETRRKKGKKKMNYHSQLIWKVDYCEGPERCRKKLVQDLSLVSPVVFGEFPMSSSATTSPQKSGHFQKDALSPSSSPEKGLASASLDSNVDLLLQNYQKQGLFRRHSMQREDLERAIAVEEESSLLDSERGGGSNVVSPLRTKAFSDDMIMSEGDTPPEIQQEREEREPEIEDEIIGEKDEPDEEEGEDTEMGGYQHYSERYNNRIEAPEDENDLKRADEAPSMVDETPILVPARINTSTGGDNEVPLIIASRSSKYLLSLKPSRSAIVKEVLKGIINIHELKNCHIYNIER